MVIFLWILLCAKDTYCRYNWKVVHTNQNQFNSLDPSVKVIDETNADHGRNPPEVEAKDAEVWANHMDLQAKDGAKLMGKQNENGPMKFKNLRKPKPKKKYKDRAKSNEYKYKYEYKDGYKYEYNDGGKHKRKRAKDVVKVKEHMDGSKPQKYKVGLKPNKNKYKVKSKPKKYKNEANAIKYEDKDGGKPKNLKDGHNVKKYIYQQVNE